MARRRTTGAGPHRPRARYFIVSRTSGRPRYPFTPAGVVTASARTVARLFDTSKNPPFSRHSMVALGAPAHAQRWDIGIRDPRDPTPCFAHLRLGQGQAISTVEEYERFIVAEGRAFGGSAESPARRPVAGLVSVTVLAPNAMRADSKGAVLLALEPADAKRLAHKRADLSVILIERGADGVDVIRVESDLREWLTLDDQRGARLRVEYY